MTVTVVVIFKPQPALLSLLASGASLFSPQTSTPAPLTGSSARTTAASHCAGCATVTTTAATTRTSPTPPAQVRTQFEQSRRASGHSSVSLTCTASTCASPVWTVEFMVIWPVQPWAAGSVLLLWTLSLFQTLIRTAHFNKNWNKLVFKSVQVNSIKYCKSLCLI